MWEPRRLTTLWDFMACYRDSFTFLLLVHLINISLSTSQTLHVQFAVIFMEMIKNGEYGKTQGSSILSCRERFICVTQIKDPLRLRSWMSPLSSHATKIWTASRTNKPTA
jgi:hypothetical protein